MKEDKLEIGDVLTLSTKIYHFSVNVPPYGNISVLTLPAINDKKFVQVPLYKIKDSRGNFLDSLICLGNRKFKVTDIIIDKNRPHHKDYIFDMAE